jgi:hypothetical protein
MIRHIFLWKVTEDGDPAYVLRRLNELPTRIPGCLSWTTGAHTGEEGISGGVWQFALVADYPSMADLEAYTNDPFHVEVVKELLPFFADRAVCDFEIPDTKES